VDVKNFRPSPQLQAEHCPDAAAQTLHILIEASKLGGELLLVRIPTNPRQEDNMASGVPSTTSRLRHLRVTGGKRHC
jgi:hypothetical protein